jgi:hypothetical protein
VKGLLRYMKTLELQAGFIDMMLFKMLIAMSIVSFVFTLVPNIVLIRKWKSECFEDFTDIGFIHFMCAFTPAAIITLTLFLHSCRYVITLL